MLPEVVNERDGVPRAGSKGGFRRRALGAAPIFASAAAALIVRHPPGGTNPTGIACAGLIIAVGVFAAYFDRPRKWPSALSLLECVAAYSAAWAFSFLIILPWRARSSILYSTNAAVVIAPIALHLFLGTTRLFHSRGLNSLHGKKDGEVILRAYLPEAVAKSCVAEARVLWFAFAWWVQRHVPEGSRSYSYHKNTRPLLWALFAAAMLELAVAHVAITAIWGLKSAWIVLALSELGALYLLGIINSVGKLPILVSDKGVRVRAGLLIDQWLPLSVISDVYEAKNCGNPKRPGFLKASLAAYPNVVISLKAPLSTKSVFGRERTFSLVGMCLDDAHELVEDIKSKVTNLSGAVEIA